MSAAEFPIFIPLFAGQGSPVANSTNARQQALRDASSPAGSLLLSSCLEAFQTEISSLCPEELEKSNIDNSDFTSETSLLDAPNENYVNNPIISGTSLFLIQTLRYLGVVERYGILQNSTNPFVDILRRNSEHNIGILGFSSGILPACVVATSTRTLTYITNAVEAFRLAFWIGLRAQIFRTTIVAERSSLPWSLVFTGVDKKSAEEAIAIYSENDPHPSLFLTAVMDDKCVTISGYPDKLKHFAETVFAGKIVHSTSVNALYHCAAVMHGPRNQLVADITRRGIQFPTFADIRVPIRSSSNGNILSKDDSSPSNSLLITLVDMILMQPVNWDFVVEKTISSIPSNTTIQLLNFGPGIGLLKFIKEGLPEDVYNSTDPVLMAQVSSGEKAEQEAIAIIGMSVRVPGARNSTELWHILENGLDTVSEIPRNRFQVTLYNQADSGRKLDVHQGNFVDGVDEFDNGFFKISPRESTNMDPQQRLLLQSAYEALENAGYIPNDTQSFQTQSFGCYIGAATQDYALNLRHEIDTYYTTGTLKAFLSGRISHFMEWSGPSIVVDTACSSSTVAIYQGCRALINGDCTAALVGGVNVITSPDMFIGLDQSHFLSRDGQCKTFDASANGYSRSEGCVTFVIKRLCDAIEENDRILGLIRGVEVNHSGKAQSITHPHGGSQTLLFEQLLKRSNIDSSSISVVEAHGTGTQAGDPTEMESIRNVFALQRPSDNPLHITSIKANIGHLEAASGAASLAKVLLMFQHQAIPRLISLSILNPQIKPLQTDNVIIDTENTPWHPFNGWTRAAVVNNFGASGSNAAILVEEYVQATPSKRALERLTLPFGLSAKTRSALEELRTRYISWLSDTEADIADIVYSTTARRQTYSYRLAMPVKTSDELVTCLRTAPVVQCAGESSGLIFVFSGQGGQYFGMGSLLYRTSSLFKKHIDECHVILITGGFTGILSIITGDIDTSKNTEELDMMQPALTALQYSLAKLWISWGMIPSVVVGHSLGEYAALVVAGVLSLRAALILVARRAQLMFSKCVCNSTGMLSVDMEVESVKMLLGFFPDVSIVCYNSARNSVLGGPLEQLRRIKNQLDTNVKCKNTFLSVPFAYHSPAMESLLDDLMLSVKNVVTSSPKIPIISNLYGLVVHPGNSSVFNRDYFAHHCIQPVLFEKGLNALSSDTSLPKIDTWVEIGPHTTILPILNTYHEISGLLLPSMKKQEDDWHTLSSSLSRLYLAGNKLSWREVFAHVPAFYISLPAYPFEKNRFWVPYNEFPETWPILSNTEHVKDAAGYSMLTDSMEQHASQNYETATYETPIDQLKQYIQGHVVVDVPICPASVFLEQILAAIELTKNNSKLPVHGTCIELRNLEFKQALVYAEPVKSVVITRISFDKDHGEFSICSRHGSVQEILHVRGTFLFCVSTDLRADSRALISRKISDIIHDAFFDNLEVVSTQEMYESIFPPLVEYAESYQSVKTLVASSTEASVVVRLPQGPWTGKFYTHPAFFDALTHIPGFLANRYRCSRDIYICSDIGMATVVPQLVDTDASYRVYCNYFWSDDREVFSAEVYALRDAAIVSHIAKMQFRKIRQDAFKKGLATMMNNKYPSPITTDVIKHTSSREVQAMIFRILAEATGLNDVQIRTGEDLWTLGVDSLMLMDFSARLQNIFPSIYLPACAISHCQKVIDLVETVVECYMKSNRGLSVT